jgi:hypothetical protein
MKIFIFLPPLTGWQLSVSAGAVAQIILEVIGLLVTDLWHTGLVIPFKATVLVCELLVPGVGKVKKLFCKSKFLLYSHIYSVISVYVRLHLVSYGLVRIGRFGVSSTSD